MVKGMTEKYRTAIIGCGRISPNHIEAFAANSDKMILTAACDPISERAAKQAYTYREKIPGASVECYTDYKKMLSEIRPDIVSVASESGKHPEIAIACMKAGAHVICEKPMALSTRDADTMISVSKETGKKLGVCFQNRFNPPVQRLREAVDSGRFGRLLHAMIQIRWSRTPAYYAEAPWRGTWAQDGGTLMNQCIHGIDLLQWIMGGEAVCVRAQTRRFIRPIEAEDFGAAIVEFKNGSVGIIEGTACTWSGDLNEVLSVFGEKGTAVIGGIAVNKLETWRLPDSETKGDTEDKLLNADQKDQFSVYGSGHTALFGDFVRNLEQNSNPLIPGTEGRKALEIILAIYKSQKTGKAVELPCEFSTLDMKDYFD